MPEQTATADAMAGLSGRDFARARRAMLSQTGKKGNGLLTPQGVASIQRERLVNASSAPATLPAAPTTGAITDSPALSFEVANEVAADVACALIESSPDVAAAVEADSGISMRDYCRQRRQALATKGKTALPPKPGSAIGGSGSSGHAVARQRRIEQSLKGRGSAPPARPSGRIRPQVEPPPKVETGTTLAGQTVTGTQVERTVKVTGNEPGSCRVITGTEYIGQEQFDKFCISRPNPAPAKVGASATSRGQVVSGTEVARTPKVTGGEAGTCKPVTGTEYLGNETFVEFCAGKNLIARPEKVVMGTSARRGLTITGSDEARPVAVTGVEAGARRTITGSQYNDAGVSRLTINGPRKVALTHTLAGRPVSGTEVGRSFKVTGDEAGACRTISGTEYLSNEQFQSICHTRPPAGAAKVGEAASLTGQRITGNLVERTAKVTGNEPRAEGRITGSQYERCATPGTAPAKVREMHTLAGRPVTGGLLVGRVSPKLSGDERGGCQPVTGTEYAGAEQAAACPTLEPVTPAAKVDVTHTLRGQVVSGTPLGRSTLVTGDEPGSHLAISGTPYAASEQVAGACGCGCGCKGPESAEVDTLPQAHPRFQPPGRTRAMAMSMMPAEPRPQSFSVTGPAREARSRITGTGYGGSGRITGPVNMATGLVSGTPEFRYRDEGSFIARNCRDAMPSQAAVGDSRITGEGRDAGQRITGDDWGRSERVTGTEGRWAQTRNPTLRGVSCGMSAGAWANKGRERPEVPLAKVTGSSGNAGKGAVVTVSGGARG